MTQIVNFNKDSITEVVYTKLTQSLRALGIDCKKEHLKWIDDYKIVNYIESLKGETKVNVGLDFKYDFNDNNSVVKFTPIIVVNYGDKSVKFKMNTYKFNDPLNNLFIVSPTDDDDLLTCKEITDELYTAIEDEVVWLNDKNSLNRVRNILTNIVQDVISTYRIDSSDDEYKVATEDKCILAMNYTIIECGFGLKIVVKMAKFEKSEINNTINVVELPSKYADNLTTYIIQL